jgi:myo-inositol-1(or 4)-monophosphatase
MTDEEQLVRRMAKSVIGIAAQYLNTHEDFADVLKHRPHDLTRRIDMVAEEALNRAVLEEGIAARIISEELGERIVPASGQPEYTLVLDPIDGSNNAISGIPYFCTSLALSKKTIGATFGDIDAAAVASIAGGTFSAQKGKGARLDGKPISVKERPEKPRYAIYSYDAGPIPTGIIALQEEHCVVRTLGSIALDLCLLARGSLDVVVDTRKKLSGYDILAGTLILKEAGGCVTDLSGNHLSSLPVTASSISIVAAANETVRSNIIKRLSR